MRLFVALVPSAEAVGELAGAVEPVRDLAPELRWTPAEQWHLTLAFLGEVDGHANLAGRLGRAARRAHPLTLSLGGAGRFGHRVFWTRVRGEVDGLRRLADTVRAAARRARLPVEDRAYRPHLTLARARQGESVDLRPVVGALAGFDGTPWRAAELVLVHSRLGAGPGGRALHEPVTAWPLGG